MLQNLIHACLAGGSPTDPKTRQRCGSIAGKVGIGANALLFLGKLGAGLFTGSVAMVADAVNNLADAAGSIVTLVGFRLAGKQADADHPFGHGRMEYVAGLIVSMAILLMGFELAKTSLSALFQPAAAVFSPLAAGLLLGAIGVKFFLYRFNKALGKAIGSAAMEATAADSLSDCAATGAVLLSSILGQFTAFPVDAVAGTLVSGFIFKAGWDAIRATTDPLLGKPMDPALAADIDALAVSHDYILGIHDLVYHDYGPGRAMMSFHAEVPADADLLAIHDMIDHIEREMKAKHHIETVIHMDPIVNDERTTALRAQVVQLAKEIGEELTIHDFRITAGPIHTNILFDVVVPFHFRLTDNQVRSELVLGIKALSPRYYPVIQVDRPFIE